MSGGSTCCAGACPYWAKDRKIAWKTINARGETVATAPAFRDAFFEWRQEGKVKQPYAIAMKNREMFALAGLWENWKDPESGEWVRTFTILTTRPNELVAPLHDRMPVIIAPEHYEQWLASEAHVRELIRPFDAERMIAWPESPRVNKPENDDAAILDPCRRGISAHWLALPSWLRDDKRGWGVHGHDSATGRGLKEYLGSSGSVGRVIYPIGENRAVETRWSGSSNGNAVFVPNAIAFMRALPDDETLFVRAFASAGCEAERARGPPTLDYNSGGSSGYSRRH